VFIDGQNLYKRCKELFGSPMCHPHLLAQHLAGVRSTMRPGCRFYTGRPDPNDHPDQARNLDRRLDGMRKAGVTVVTRPLRYHWDWGPAPDAPLPRPKANSAPRQATMRPWQRPREKGIDLVLALDVIEFVLGDVCDVAIVVSLDRDLFEIPQALNNLRKHRNGPFRVEAAVPVAGSQKQPKILPGFAYTHQITQQVFELVKDPTHYASDSPTWRPPVIPPDLPGVMPPLPGLSP